MRKKSGSLQELWSKMTIYDQLGNIGSEVDRVIHWKNKGESKYMQGAIDRGLELFDLSLKDKRWGPYRLKETAMVREVFCDFVSGENKYKITAESLSQYFLDFVLVARKDR